MHGVKYTLVLTLHLQGFLLYRKRKLTYFHGGKRKNGVYLANFEHKKSDGNGNINNRS